MSWGTECKLTFCGNDCRKAVVPFADLEAELQDAVNERCNIVNNEIGGYKEEAMCEKMAKD